MKINTCMSASANNTLFPVHGLCYKLVSELDYECTITFSTCDYENTAHLYTKTLCRS